LLTHRQTNKQTKTGNNITSLAEVINIKPEQARCQPTANILYGRPPTAVQHCQH